MKTITPFQFFAAIFPQPLAAGQLMVWSRVRTSGNTRTDWCYDLEQAGRQVERYRRTRDVYFGVALHDRKTVLARARRRMKRTAPTIVRGSAESVTALPALWAEIGVAGAGSGPALDALPLPPSILVSTGAALQAYWLLDRLWVLEDPEEQRRAKHLLGKLWWALASHGAVPGRPPAVGGGSDLAGLMRVAGTFRQRGQGRPGNQPPGNRCWPIAVLRLPEDASSDRYARGDFEALEDPPETPGGPPPWEAAGAGTEPEALLHPGADFRRVWRGCSWIRHCHRRQATLPEKEWAAALSIVGRARAVSGSPEGGSPDGVDGRPLAHAFSAGHPGYSRELTDQALARALAGGAATCRRIGRGLGAWDRHCSRCRHQGRIESPIVLGAGDRKEGPGAPEETPPTAEFPPATATATTEAMAPPAMAPPAVAPPAGRVAAAAPAPAAATRDGAEPLFDPTDDGRPQVEIVVRISPRSVVTRSVVTRSVVTEASNPLGDWTPVIRAAIAGLERSISTRSRDCARSGDPPAPVPRTAVPAPLIDGLEELLETLGGEGTARRMVEALAAPQNRDRFGPLRAALRDLVPGLEDGVPSAMQLGRALASVGAWSAGGRAIVRGKRRPDGVTWAVRRTEGTTVNRR